MRSYSVFAQYYDELTSNVEYPKRAEYLLELMERLGHAPGLTLDLACGTGAMSLLLAKAGYQVTGVDLSEEMLTVAYDKAVALEDNRPFFVRQSMQRLRLPEPVDWVLCCLDSINYLTDPAACRETFRRVYRALKPGGVFLFDVNTPEKLREMDGQVFLDEDDDVFCVWRGSYEETERICTYGMDLFQRQGGLWRRSQEEHRQYAYSLDELREFLQEAGFASIRMFADRRPEPPVPGEQRVYWMAIREETTHA